MPTLPTVIVCDTGAPTAVVPKSKLPVPSASVLAPMKTWISGAGGVNGTTIPETVKSKGFSLASFVSKLTTPAKVPSAVASSCTTKSAVSPAASRVDENPETRL